MFSPENNKIVNAVSGCHANAFGTGDYVSLKNARGVYIIVQHVGAGATNLDLTVNEATNVSAGSAAAITTGAEFPIWINLDCTATDTLVKQTDAITYHIAPTAVPTMVVFYIPVAKLSPGFDCVAIVGAGGNAANFASAIYILDGIRYAQGTPPSAIID
jgi:hypothetical protein